MELMMNEQGVFEEYDDAYDVVIHCDSKEARDEVLADLKAINDELDVLDRIRAEIEEWYWQADKQALAKDPCIVDTMVDLFIRMIDKYQVQGR